MKASDIIERLRQAAGVASLSALARVLGVSPPNVSQALRLEQIPEAWLYKVAYQTGCNIDWLRTGSGSLQGSHAAEEPVPYLAAPMRQVPLLTWIQAGKFTERSVPPHTGEADESVWTDVRGPRVFALRVKGDSMEPVFREGEVVLVNPEFECRPDDYVIAKLPDHGSEDATLKQLKKIGDQHFLHPLNPKHPDIPMTKRHRLVGKVVRKQLDF